MLNNGSGGYMSDSQWYPLKLYLAGKVFDSDNFLLFFLKQKCGSHFQNEDNVDIPCILDQRKVLRVPYCIGNAILKIDGPLNLRLHFL